MNWFARVRQAFSLAPAEKLAAARSELARVERDMDTVAAMLDQHKDSFHHALGANTTGHVQELEERRQLLLARIQALLAEHSELE